MELMDLRSMILSLRITDLQTLLASVSCKHSGKKWKKVDLQNRAADLLINPPRLLNLEDYKQKIRELFGQEPVQIQLEMHQRDLDLQSRACGVPASQFSHPAPITGKNVLNNYANVIHRNGSSYAYPTMFIQTPGIVECNISNTVQFKQKTTPSSVRFKMLPFFNVKQEVLHPTILMSNSPTTLRVNGKINNTHEFTVSFVLTCRIASEIAMHRDITNKKHTVQLQLRVCAIDPNTSLVSDRELDDFMPLGLVVRVNGVQCNTLPQLSPSSRPNQDVRRIPGPIDISSLLRLSPRNINNLTINWIPEISKKFSITLNLVEKLSADFLLNKLKERPPLNVDLTKTMIRKQYRRVVDDDDDTNSADNEDDDIATTIVRVSLMCPLAKFRMIHPAKGKNCSHLQCFDGSAFISLNEKKSMWMCPVCHKQLSFDDLLIDQYFVDVLHNEELLEECQEVQLLVDGAWKSYFEENTADVSNEKQSGYSPANSPTSLSIVEKESVADSSKSTINDADTIINGADTVVDLTCDDDDDDEMTNIVENSPVNNVSSVSSPVHCSVIPTSVEGTANEDATESLVQTTSSDTEDKVDDVMLSGMEMENINTTSPTPITSKNDSACVNQNVIASDSPMHSISSVPSIDSNDVE